MKYSLFVVVTLVCVGLGGVMGRVECLRRWAVYHERKSVELREETFSELYTISDYHNWNGRGRQLVDETPPPPAFYDPDSVKPG